MRKLVLLILIFYIQIISCNVKTPISTKDRQIIIQGFLYSHQPIDDIQIMWSDTFDHNKNEFSFEPINNADVTIIKQNQKYKLLPNLKKNGYWSSAYH